MAKIMRKTFPELTDLVGVINAMRLSAIGPGAAFHIDASEQTITSPNATDLPSAITLINEMAFKFGGQTVFGGAGVPGGWLGHVNDAPSVTLNGIPGVVHKAQDATNTMAGAATAVDLATAQTLVNLIKTNFNAHLTQAGVHFSNDLLNTVNTANATDLASTQTLANALKTAVNAHFANALGGQSIRAISA